MNRKSEQVTFSHRLVATLQSERSSRFHNVTTGDGSWFVLSYPRESVWEQSRDKVPAESATRLTQKSALFQSFGLSMGSSVLLVFQKGGCIIQHFFGILSCPVWLTKSVHILEENHWNVCTSGWTMHIRAIQGAPPNVIERLSLSRHRVQVAVQTSRQVTYSSSAISGTNLPDMRSHPHVQRTWTRVPHECLFVVFIITHKDGIPPQVKRKGETALQHDKRKNCG
jgi:hypothetical protein